MITELKYELVDAVDNYLKEHQKLTEEDSKLESPICLDCNSFGVSTLELPKVTNIYFNTEIGETQVQYEDEDFFLPLYYCTAEEVELIHNELLHTNND